MTQDRTITVAGYFGDKEVTFNQFVGIWMNHFKEVKRLDYSDSWLDTCKDFEIALEAKCREEFERIFEAQSK